MTDIPLLESTQTEPVLKRLAAWHGELTDIRRDIHAHPELGLDVPRTAKLVAENLRGWGIEVHEGIGGHGVVGVLRGGNGPAIGLRVDMDALPMQEETGLEHASRTPGRMHACGHDGHTAMLLGAARYLAETKRFSGTVNFIFQPGEEGCGGALAMLEDGLLERFPCDALFGMHNAPGTPVGKFALAPGAAMSGGAFFDITITGKEGHGARPEKAIDPVLTACHIATALQSVVSRNVPPLEPAVLSITQIRTGEAYNIIPSTAVMSGTVRALRRETMELMEEAMRRVVCGVAAGFGATADLDYRLIFAPLQNAQSEARDMLDAARELVGEDNVNGQKLPAAASEDFSFMLEKVPGAYIHLG
ncbi:MAG: amidohydrolase, partial [Beijerinckiaceae bacterium]